MPTLKQQRLAEALEDPTIKTKTAALIRAGYSEKSAASNTAQAMGGNGVSIETQRLKKRRQDSARGLSSVADRLVKRGGSKVEEMDPAQAMALGLKAIEVSASIGDSINEAGNGEAFKAWRRKAMRRAWRAGFRAALAGRDPLNLALPPTAVAPEIEESAAAETTEE